MDVRFVTAGGTKPASPEDLPGLLARTDGFVWVDIPAMDERAELLLTGMFHVHPLVLEACRRRNHVPTVHGYAGHYFVVLHVPLLGSAGHVHLLEVDQIVGSNFLVTVHGPLNPLVDPQEALVETSGVLQRIEAGRLAAESPTKVSYALGSAIARRQRALVGTVAEKIPGLEHEVMSSSFREPETLLEAMFLIRHELITARTMAAQSHDIFARLMSLDSWLPEHDVSYVRDLADQFDRVRSIGDGEAQFLFGVIELYQTKVNTKMTVAMERLAVIAAVTLPITAIASVYGMNMIVNASTHYVELGVVLLVMLLLSTYLVWWARKQGWW